MDIAGGSSEIQFTCSPLTSDHPIVPTNVGSIGTPIPPPDSVTVNASPTDTASRDSAVHTPSPTHDTGLLTQHDSTEIVQDHTVILSACSTPLVCEQIEIVTEEKQSAVPQTTLSSVVVHTAQHSNEAHLPQIDAVWSIGQEHSYEQRPWKNKTQDCFLHTDNGLVEPDTDKASDRPTQAEHSTQPVDTYHMATLPLSDNAAQDNGVPMASLPHSDIAGEEIDVPCVLHVSPELKVHMKASKRYVLSNPKGHTHMKRTESAPVSCKKSYRNVKVLKVPPSPPSQSASSWSNGLIDHNLKPLQIHHNLLLSKTQHKPDALTLDKSSMQYDHPNPFTHHFPVNADPHLYTPPTLSTQIETLTASQSYVSDVDEGEEVGTDAVYMDIAQSPSLHRMVDPMASPANLQDLTSNLSMQQYLPDISDLPQFNNIPPDGLEDPCTEPTHLIPSIDHSVLDSGWLPADPWCSYTATTTMATHTFSGSTITHTDSILSTTASSVTEDLFSMGTMQRDAVSEGDAGKQMMPTECSLPLTATTAATPSVTSTASATVTVKTEDLWPLSADSSHRHDPSDGSDLMTMTALNPDHAISSAVMTALDMQPHPSPLVPPPHSGTPTQPDPLPYLYQDSGSAGMGCSSTFLSPPPSVEQLPSQCSTPCPDNESGYLTMEEQSWPSPGGMAWPQHNPYPPAFTSTTDSYNHHQPTPLYAPADYGGGEGSSYPYTHQDSHYQTLHQTASCSLTTTYNNNNDIIYYPFNDLMQLNPNLLCEDMSVQYGQSHPYNHAASVLPPAADATSHPALAQSSSSRKRGRGGRGRGARQVQGSQIQSDLVTSSHHRQLQVQMEAPHKRHYKRRNPEGRKKPPPSRAAPSSADGGEKKGRHNEPLKQKAVDIMFEWYQQHEENPYPSKEEKERMALNGGITTMQVKSWFANKRNRSNNTRPKVQKRAMEEKLMHIYNQLSKTEGTNVQEGGNSFIIKELSQIIHKKLEPEVPGTPESAT